MLKNSPPEPEAFTLRCVVAVLFCLSGGFLAALSFAGTAHEISELPRNNTLRVTKHVQRLSRVPQGQSTTASGLSGPGWSIVTSPNEPVTGSGNLQSVTCSTESDCWAVGVNSDASKTLVEHWNGGAWTIVDSPNKSFSWLNGVTCASANDCWIVGNTFDSHAGSDVTLIEHWNGSVWSIAPSPNENPAYSLLYDVACSASDDCWAVGYSSNGGLVEHWDGSNWTIVPSANGAGGASVLYGVTCQSLGECWAVGISGVQRPIIERWEGIAWTVSPSPIVSSFSYLVSASCLSATQCFAVGVNSGNGLIEQWDGTSWTFVNIPGGGDLVDITCGLTTCWAVGGDGGRTFIAYWDGNSWKVVPSPNPNTFGSHDLLGVVCPSSLQCWAVGHTYGNTQPQTLIEEYSLTVPPLIAVGSRMVHGTAGTFDVDLPIVGQRGVECRTGGANGNYSVVFTFVNDVTDCGIAGTTGGSVVAGPNTNQCTENLTGIANAQYVDLELDNVVDALNNTGNVSVPMGVLIGDTTANGLVNSTDISQTQSQSGQTLTIDNFREDVTLNGLINSSDVSLIQSASGTALPSSP